MKHETFRFSPRLWLGNRSLRACTPAARGFWIDLMALMHPSGYLALENGKPMSDNQIAALVGAPVRLVRGWLRELGDAGIFSVSDDNRLYCSRMVKDAEFVKQAKDAGERGQARKKEKRNPEQRSGPPVAESQAPECAAPGDAGVASSQAPALPDPPAVIVAPAPAPPQKKPLDWWKYPAGWVRQGALQAMSMKPGEALEDFQIRVAARIPAARHLDFLTPGQRAAVEAATPKDPNAKKDEK